MHTYIYVRLLMLTQMEEFQNELQSIKNGEQYKHILKLVETNSIEQIDIPNSFGEVLYSNLIISDLESCDIDIDVDKIYTDLTYSMMIYDTLKNSKDKYNLEPKTIKIGEGESRNEILKNVARNELLKILVGKQDEDSVPNERLKARVQVIIGLLQLSWRVIQKFFPISKYGIPSVELIIKVMGVLIDNDIIIDKWKINMFVTHDKFGILKEQKIKYLEEKVRQLSISNRELLKEIDKLKGNNSIQNEIYKNETDEVYEPIFLNKYKKLNDALYSNPTVLTEVTPGSLKSLVDENIYKCIDYVDRLYREYFISKGEFEGDLDSIVIKYKHSRKLEKKDFIEYFKEIVKLRFRDKKSYREIYEKVEGKYRKVYVGNQTTVYNHLTKYSKIADFGEQNQFINDMNIKMWSGKRR